MKEALTLSSLIIYILNILKNFRHIILQSARKFNPPFRKGILQIKWVSFYNLNVIFMTSLIFPFIFIHVQLFSVVFNILGTRNSLKKEDWQNWSNKCVANSNIKLTQILTALLHERAYLKDYRILSKNALTNWYVRCVSANQVIRKFSKTI